MLDRLAMTLRGILASRTGQPDDVAASWLTGENWFSSDQALELGLATHVEGAAAAAALVAAPLGRFNRVPAALARLQKQELLSMTTVAEAPAGTAGGNVTEAEGSGANAVMLERARVGEIARLCGLPQVRGALKPGYAEEAITKGTSLDAVRAHIIDAMAAREEQMGDTRTGVRTVIGGYSGDDPTALVGRLQAALTTRLSHGRIECPPEAREFLGAPVAEMARELLQARGERDVRWMSRDRVLHRAMGAGVGKHTTSDFASLLQGAGERTLMDTFQRTRSEVARVARQTTVPDFKDITRVRRGEAPALEEVREAGEVKHGSVGEDYEKYRIKSFAKAFSISRNALINDDLGAFADFLGEMGRATAATENSELMALLALNSNAGPTMSDGVALFHTNHGNVLTTGSSLDAASLGDARTLLRRMKGMAADNYLNIRPRFLVVPPELESTAISIIASEVGASNEANPVRNLAEILVEPRLSGTAWYLFGDPADAPVLEWAYLDGTRTGATTNGQPLLETFEDPSVLGVLYRVVHDFGLGAVGWRGAVRATGAA